MRHAIKTTGFSVHDTLRSAVMTLQRARIESASLDARILLEHVLGVSRERLLAGDAVEMTQQQDAQYQALIAKRAARQPVAQLIGKREFWGRDFTVTADTLDPRPDSETLIETVLNLHRDKNAPLQILDLGTGTGCLLLTLLSEYGSATGTGVDRCDKALKVAQANAASLGLAKRATFVRSHWNTEIHGQFDIVISNPPYIPSKVIPTLQEEVCRWEPLGALDGGADGLDCYREIIAQLPLLLTPQGVAIFEIGIGQAPDVTHIAHTHQLNVSAVKEDMAGIPRCMVITQSLSL